MSLQRTPPGSQERLNIPNTSTQYASDPSLNTLNSADSEDNFINFTKRQKRTFGEFSTHSSSYFSEIKAMISELKEQQDSKFESINNTLLTIMTQNQDIQKSIENLKNKHDILSLKINNLEIENEEGRKKISILENRIDMMDKKSRYTSIEIRNLPKQSGESKRDLTKLIQKIGTILEVESPIEELEIRELYRNKTDALLVDFTTALRKESLISKFKKYNKTRRENREPLLNTEHLMLSGTPSTLFISENLSLKTRRIFFIARQMVKNKKLYTAWTSFGKVYVKINEGAIPTCINDESELDKII